MLNRQNAKIPFQITSPCADNAEERHVSVYKSRLKFTIIKRHAKHTRTACSKSTHHALTQAHTAHNTNIEKPSQNMNFG